MADVGGPIIGTPGNDYLLGDARDLGDVVDNYFNEINGGDGDDIIVGDLYSPVSYNTEGDVLHGGAGNDIIYGDTAPDLSALGFVSSWLGDPIWNTRLEGSGDHLYGDAGNDWIYGGGGSDQIWGGIGADRLFGGNGFDWLEGGAGIDRIWGGAHGDTVYGGAGADLIWGGGGNDALYGEDFFTSAGDGGDVIRGGAGHDDIRGGAGADRLFGDAGNDDIVGGGLWSDATNDLGDFCAGGAGNDRIDGRFGNDKLFGGLGQDQLTGGEGKDVFIYRTARDSLVATPDKITDFDVLAKDRIDLSKIDAITGGGDDAFTFIGANDFTGDGQVRVTTVGASTFVDINISGTLAADMRIELVGIIDLSQGHFIL